jgi:molecular chaperone DnaK (HSP70)
VFGHRSGWGRRLVLAEGTALRLGIDFGTTRTVVALSDRGNYPVLGFETAEGTALDHFPSIVAEVGGQLLYGIDAFDAISSSDSGSVPVLRSFKRLLTDGAAIADQPVQVGCQTIGLFDLTVGFLTSLRHAIVKNAKTTLEEGMDAVPTAVVGVPANANSSQRFLTLEAFRAAGYPVIQMMNEPSAAAVEYAHRYRDTVTARRQNVLVYDLGGGTFDASLVSLYGGGHEVLGSRGRSKLGGDDFDAILMELVLSQLDVTRDALGKSACLQLQLRCQAEKERLGPNTRRILVDLEGIDGLGAGGPQKAVAIATSDYYEACDGLVAETMEVVERLLVERLPVGLDADSDSQLAGVYVVGGGSTLPVVGRKLRELFGRRLHRSPHPSASTAVGLAIAADAALDYRVTERLSRSFGVFREADSGKQIAFDSIFSEATLLPGQGSRTELVRRYRPEHNIGHFRYIECGFLDSDGVPGGDITPYAEVYFPFDPSLRRKAETLASVTVERLPEQGALIEERYALDASGVVQLTIRDVENHYETRHTLFRSGETV